MIDSMDFTVLSTHSGIYRDGGSLSCMLQCPKQTLHELIFPIKSIDISSQDLPRYLRYKEPEIYIGRWHQQELAQKLNWDEAHTLLFANKPPKGAGREYRWMRQISLKNYELKIS